MECLRFFVSGQTWACGLLASEAAAHNLKGERAPVALCREPTEAAAETVGSNPAPATTSSTHMGTRFFMPLMGIHTKEFQQTPCGLAGIFRFWARLSSCIPRFAVIGHAFVQQKSATPPGIRAGVHSSLLPFSLWIKSVTYHKRGAMYPALKRKHWKNSGRNSRKRKAPPCNREFFSFALFCAILIKNYDV